MKQASCLTYLTALMGIVLFGCNDGGEPFKFSTTSDEPARPSRAENPVLEKPGNASNTPRSGKIGDLVWLDLDADGSPGSHEPGVSGVTVYLTCAGEDEIIGTGDDITDNTTTNAKGRYLFTGLPPGECRVWINSAELPAGLMPGDCSTSRRVRVDPPPPGIAITTVDFCLMPSQGLAEIGDLVWLDDNDNGVADAGEPGLAGVTVELACTGLDGTFGTSDDVQASTATDALGHYLFSGITAGECRVSVDKKSVPKSLKPGRCIAIRRVRVDPPPPGIAILDVDFCFQEK